MLIDCTTCVARDIACNDCVISVLLATPPPSRKPSPAAAPDLRPGGHDDPLDLDESARYALGNLAQAGLVPPLRLVASLRSSSEADGRESRVGREIA